MTLSVSHFWRLIWVLRRFKLFSMGLMTQKNNVGLLTQNPYDVDICVPNSTFGWKRLRRSHRRYFRQSRRSPKSVIDKLSFNCHTLLSIVIALVYCRLYTVCPRFVHVNSDSTLKLLSLAHLVTLYHPSICETRCPPVDRVCVSLSVNIVCFRTLHRRFKC